MTLNLRKVWKSNLGFVTTDKFDSIILIDKKMKNAKK